MRKAVSTSRCLMERSKRSAWSPQTHSDRAVVRYSGQRQWRRSLVSESDLVASPQRSALEAAKSHREVSRPAAEHRRHVDFPDEPQITVVP